MPVSTWPQQARTHGGPIDDVREIKYNSSCFDFRTIGGVRGSLTSRRSKREGVRRGRAQRKRQAPSEQGSFFSRLSANWIVGGLIGSVVAIALLIFILAQVVGGGRVITSPIVQVFSIAASPADPQTVFLGDITGLLRSTDGGGSWQPHVITDPVRVVYNDPNDPNVFFAAGAMMVRKSVDGGESWQPLTFDLPTGSIGALAVDPAESSTVYAFLSGENGLYRSQDGGASWSQQNPLVAETAGAPPSLTSLAIKPGAPDTVYAFHTIDGFVISINGGRRFDPAGDGLPKNAVTDLFTFAEEPETVFAAAASSIYKSTNSGRTWAVSDSGLDGIRILALTRNSGTGHLLASDLQGNLYFSTDGGELWERNEST